MTFPDRRSAGRSSRVTQPAPQGVQHPHAANVLPDIEDDLTGLVDYHGGGDEAAFEALSDHPEAFEMALAQYMGYGVAACWRGPELFDSDATKAIVDKCKATPIYPPPEIDLP